MVNSVQDDPENTPRTALDDVDELLQDIAFEAANRLDWVAIVKQGFPALPEDQEQVLKDMGEAFAADQLVQRMWDGPSPSNDDRRWIADVTMRLATRYDLDLPQTVPALLQEWRAASRPAGREFGGGHRRRR